MPSTAAKSSGQAKNERSCTAVTRGRVERRAGRCRRGRRRRRRRPLRAARARRRSAHQQAALAARSPSARGTTPGRPRAGSSGSRPAKYTTQPVRPGSRTRRGGGCAGSGRCPSAGPGARARRCRWSAGGGSGTQHAPVELERPRRPRCPSRRRGSARARGGAASSRRAGSSRIFSMPSAIDRVSSGFDEGGRVARDLLERGSARADDGQAGGHGLDHGQAEALLQRRQHERGGRGHERADLARLQVAGGPDLRPADRRRPAPIPSPGPPGRSGGQAAPAAGQADVGHGQVDEVLPLLVACPM